MSTRTIGRASAAAILALGLLVASALPAAASATHLEILPSSTLIFQPSTGGTPIYTAHIPGHETTATTCPSFNSQPDPHIPVSLDSSTGGTIGAASTRWLLFTYGTANFKIRLNITGGTLTFSATGASVTLTLTSTFRTCDSLTTLCTTNAFTITLGTAAGAPNPGHHPTASTTTRVTGTSSAVTTPISCNSILRSIFHGTHVAANLSLHFTDSAT